MSTDVNVFGVIIVYNPSADVLSNIRSYIGNLDTLFIYDNSSLNNEYFFKPLCDEFSIEYIHNGRNDGISKSINVVAERLYDVNNSWLLTMDQDSSFEKETFKEMISFASLAESSVGIISPFHNTALNKKKSTLAVEEKLTVMTSGNLLNIAVHKKIGGFDEKYFIDCVDWEYCLKLSLYNYKVIMLNNIELIHGLGNPFKTKSLMSGKEIVILNHNHLRRYYITRNKLLIASQYLKKYPKLSLKYLRSLIKDLIKIIFYEDEKTIKIRFYFKGIKHFIFRKFGSIHDH